MSWSSALGQAGQQAPYAPTPLILFFALFTIALMVFRQYAHLSSRSARMQNAGDEELLNGGPGVEPSEALDHLDSTQPVAVFLLGGQHELGPRALRIFENLYSKEYRQVLFVSVGIMDYAVIDAGVDREQGFKGTEEAKRLKRKTRLSLDPFLADAHGMGLKVDCRVSLGTNPVDEIDTIAGDVVKIYPKAVFFVSKLVFEKKRWFHRFLHGETGTAICRRLEKKGYPVTVLPVVIPQ
jgi:hypothetical protein